MNKPLVSKQLELIVNAVEKRDELLDALDDILQSSPLEEAEALALVNDLSRTIEFGSEDVTLESFFNVLSTLYLQGKAKAAIESLVIEQVESLPVSAMVHVLEIVGLSDLPTKHDLLTSYSMHSNSYLSALAKSFLARKGGVRSDF